VLLLDGQTQLFALFLPAYRAELDAAEREGRHLRGEPDSDVDRPALERLGPDVWVNHGAVILRRPAVRYYLDPHSPDEVVILSALAAVLG